MAKKRMLNKSICDSDIFLNLEPTAQNLYFHLNIRADDEGFIDSPNGIMRLVSATKVDMDALLDKKYILKFKSGVVVIKHWKLHNAIRKDRIEETNYIEERQQLSEKDNGAYTICQTSDGQSAAKCPHSIVKVSIVESSIVKIRLGDFDLSVNEWFEKLWNEYPKKDGKKEALRHFTANVKNSDDLLDFTKALKNYLTKIEEEQTKSKYIKNGSTFFNNYKDFINYKTEDGVDEWLRKMKGGVTEL